MPNQLNKSKFPMHKLYSAAGKNMKRGVLYSTRIKLHFMTPLSIQTHNKLPREIFPLFWDIDLAAIDYDKHKNFIISRILEKTTSPALRWLEKVYSRDDIVKVNENDRRITTRSRNFWRLWYAER